MSIFAGFRLIQAGWVLTREGVVASLPRDGLSGPALFGHKIATGLSRRRADKLNNVERMNNAISRLGPSYAKLGQFLATRPDIIGLDMAVDLAGLQDNMAQFPLEQSIARIEDSLGAELSSFFTRVEPAIAAASIAQVHPAYVMQADGSEKKVAIKVLRPGVRSRFKKDLEAFHLFAELQEKFITSAKRLRPTAVADTLAQSTRIEMDLRLEAAALSEIAENTKDDPDFRVPKVDWVRTGRNVLTMDWVDGIKMTDTEALINAGHNPKKLAVNIIQSFLRHAIRDGFFHADMHPGNLFVDAEGDIVGVDLGIVGRIGLKERRFLAEILLGFITRDYRRVAEVHFDAGYVPKHHSIDAFAQAIRAVGEPIHDQDAETISMGNLLTLLFDVTDIFDMETRPELVLLQKTMVVVEGNARMLDPQFNMWEAAEPIVSEWVRRNLGPAAVLKDSQEGIKAGLRLLKQLPDLADRTEQLAHDIGNMTENGMLLSNETINAIGKAEARESRWGRIALVVIAVSMAYIAWVIS